MWDAQDFVNSFRDTRALIRMAHYTGGKCDGHAWALILSDIKQIAIMLEDCCSPEKTLVKAGAIVNFSPRRGRNRRIVGEPAYFLPVTVGDRDSDT